MHALGVITVNYNLFERILFGILAHHLDAAGLSFKECQFLAGRMNNRERLEAIRFIFAEREKDSAVRDHIEHLIGYFKRCAEKRNILAHSMLEGRLEKKDDGGWYPAGDGSELELMKSSKDGWAKINRYRLTLTDLRGIADETRLGYRYAFSIAIFLMGRDGKAGALGSLLPGSLPQKPPLPRNLTIHPPEAPPNSGHSPP